MVNLNRKTSDEILAECKTQATETKEVDLQEEPTIGSIARPTIEPELKREIAEFLIDMDAKQESEDEGFEDDEEEQRQSRIKKLRELAKGCIINEIVEEKPTPRKARSWQ